MDAQRLNGGILDDFYLNLLDWGSADTIAVASGATVVLLRQQDHPNGSSSFSICGKLGHNTLLDSGSPGRVSIGGQDARCSSSSGLSSPRMLHSSSSMATPLARFAVGVPGGGLISPGGGITGGGGLTSPMSSHRNNSSSAQLGASNSSEAEYTSVKWNPDGSDVAIGTRHGTVEIWNVTTGRIKGKLTGHTHRVGILDWVPSAGSCLISSGSRDKSIITHDLRSPVPIEKRFDKHKQEVCGLRWRESSSSFPSLAQLATDSNDTYNEPALKGVKDTTGKTDLPNTPGSVQEIFEEERKRTEAAAPITADAVRVYVARSLKEAVEENRDVSTNTSPLRTNVPILASGGNDNRVYLWELGYSAPLMRLPVHTAAVKALYWAPVSHPILATGGGTNDRTIRIWDVEQRRELATYETESQVCNLFWSRATLELVSSHGYTLNQINIWDFQNTPAFIRGRCAAGELTPLALRRLATLTGHSARVLYMSGSPDGRKMATATGESIVRIWAPFADGETATAPM